MKIAIVHDQLQEFGGAERVLVALKNIYPEADIYTSFYKPEGLGIHRPLVESWNVHTSWAQRVPGFARFYSPLRFITPLIWEPLNLNAYDVVISSSGSYMSHGVVTRPGTLHICYMHHPPRYLYYYETAREWQKYRLIEIYGHMINHGLRMWDYLAAQRVDHFVANSHETAARIAKFYRRDSDVIYPPVTVEKSHATPDRDMGARQYITVSRLARAKHIEVMIQSANKYGFKLKIVGHGRDESRLKSLASNNVEFVGSVSDEALARLYAESHAFLFSAVDEEFGIAPIEAMGHHLPVVAYSSGGLRETVKHGVNGYLYESMDPDALYEQIRALEHLNARDYKKMCESARTSSEHYSQESFKKQITSYVNAHLSTSV